MKKHFFSFEYDLSKLTKKAISEQNKSIYDELFKNKVTETLQDFLFQNSKWYHFLICFGIVGIGNLSLNLRLDFFDLEKIEESREIHDYLTYIGTFISITLIVTTFLFNFLKATVESNFNLIIKYVGYEMVAYYGFTLVIFLVIVKFFLPKFSNHQVNNFLFTSFFLTLLFFLLLTYLYSRIFKLIRPDELRKIHLKYIKSVCSQHIYQELFIRKSFSIYNEMFKKFGYDETSNADYFFLGNKIASVNYFFKGKKPQNFYLKDFNISKFLKKYVFSKEKKVFVPLHINQKFPPNSDYLLIGFENLGNMSYEKVHTDIHAHFKFSKGKNELYEKTKALNESMLHKVYQNLDQALYQKDYRSVNNCIDDLDLFFDLYIENLD